MRQPPETGECLHCEQPIRKFYPYDGADGEWMHIDGRHAYPECRGLRAVPKGE